MSLGRVRRAALNASSSWCAQPSMTGWATAGSALVLAPGLSAPSWRSSLAVGRAARIGSGPIPRCGIGRAPPCAATWRRGEEAELQGPAESATTSWCAACGGIDAPQPCLGIRIWRPVDWVNRAVYEQQRERVLAEREMELRLSRLPRRLASVTPRHGRWERGWRVLRAEAQEALRQSSAESVDVTCRPGCPGPRQ